MQLQGKRVLVVGLGRSGVGAAHFCAARGAHVTATDQRGADSLAPELAQLAGCAALELGGHRERSFVDGDLIILSPGVPEIPELQAARRAGVPILGELELSYRFVQAPVIAVTGTNGKSTTTALLGAMVEASGRPTFTGGNLGVPLVEAIGSDAAGPSGALVLELSSFQLETVETFRARIALLLNLSEDHLDRYPTYASYLAAKARVFERQTADDWAVVNGDVDQQDCRRLAAASSSSSTRSSSAAVSSSSASAAAAAASSSSVSSSSAAVSSSSSSSSSSLSSSSSSSPPRARLVTFRLERGASGEPGAWLAGDELQLQLPGGALERIGRDALQLAGRHNVQNALAALLGARLFGVELGVCERALRAFRGLPHRMELVAEHDGVRFYNDSKATNVGSVVGSLAGFERPVVLIAGGKDKGGDYAPLVPLLCQGARHVVLIGAAADKIERALHGVLPLHRAVDLPAAVQLAAELARPGDAVVLSPACSSYDMFKNYEERGQVFADAARRLVSRPTGLPGGAR